MGIVGTSEASQIDSTNNMMDNSNQSRPPIQKKLAPHARLLPAERSLSLSISPIVDEEQRRRLSDVPQKLDDRVDDHPNLQN